MKKIVALLLALVMVLSCTAIALADGELIKVGIINLDPSESGYRQANVKNLTDTFTAENGYDATFVTAPTADKQLEAAKGFITAGVKYILVSAAETTGWDEVLEGTPDPDVTVLAWTSPKAILQSAHEGHPTIACPIQHLYFSNPRWNRLTGRESVSRVYDFEIAPRELSEKERRSIIGAEGCIWTEWVADSTKLEWEMLPRLAALAELQWGAEKDLDAFLPRLQRLTSLYDRRGWNWKEDIAEAWD